jgi:hypothetical protein
MAKNKKGCGLVIRRRSRNSLRLVQKPDQTEDYDTLICGQLQGITLLQTESA